MHQYDRRVRRLAPALLVILAATPLLLASWTLAPTAFFAGDAGPKYLQAAAFARHQSWPRTIPYPAHVIDPSFRYLPVSMTAVHGRAVSFFPFLFPLIAALGYPLAGRRALLVLPALAALIAAWLVGRLAARLGGGQRAVLPTAALALAATPLMFYGSCIWAHSLVAAVVLGALELSLAALGSQAPRDGTWIAAGILAGIAGWIRTEGFLFLALAAVPFVWQRDRTGLRGSLAAGTGGLLGVAAGAVLQRLALGAWLPVHIVHVMDRHVFSVPFLTARFDTIRHLFVPDPWCGVALLIWFVALILAFWRPHAASTTLLAMTAIAAGLAAAIGAPVVRFLEGTSPASAFPVRSATAVWVLLAALPLALARARPRDPAPRRAAMVIGSVAAGFVLVFILASPVDGGYQWGARLFLPVVLMLTALLAARLAALRHPARLERAAIAATIAAAVLVQLFGMALLVHVTRGNAAFEAALASQTGPGETVVTDTFYLPELGAPIWSARRFLLLKSAHDVADLLGRLHAARVRTWVFASAGDVNLGLAPHIERAARTCGWRLATTRVLQLPGRTLTLARYTPSSSPGTRKTASSSRLPF